MGARTYQTRFLGSPQNLQQGFMWVNGVPVTQKSGRENRPNLEFQIFEVWSLPWVATCEWVMSHTPLSHIVHINESCRTHHRFWGSYVWMMQVMAYVWMSHVIHTIESCRAHKWVMSHALLCLRFIYVDGASPITRINKSRLTHELHMNEFLFTYEWVMSHAY